MKQNDTQNVLHNSNLYSLYNMFQHQHDVEATGVLHWPVHSEHPPNTHPDTYKNKLYQG